MHMAMRKEDLKGQVVRRSSERFHERHKDSAYQSYVTLWCLLLMNPLKAAGPICTHLENPPRRKTIAGRAFRMRMLRYYSDLAEVPELPEESRKVFAEAVERLQRL